MCKYMCSGDLNTLGNVLEHSPVHTVKMVTHFLDVKTQQMNTNSSSMSQLWETHTVASANQRIANPKIPSN